MRLVPIVPGPGLMRLLVPVAMAAVAGCGFNNGSGPYGPLAVERTTMGMEALGSGTLEIDGSCAFLVSGGERWLLVWPEGPTAWDPVAAEVAFTRRDGAAVRMGDGDRVELGGGAIGRDTGAVFDQVTWVAPPAPQCEQDTRWHVSDALPPG